MTSTQVGPSPEPTPPDGLRERKKQRTRVAIEDAALDLFEEQGYDATTVDQIAARAEVAPATLFRYFTSKSELVVGENNQHLPAIRQAILHRPVDENGLVAVRRAIVEQWVPAIDPRTTARRARIVASSDLLSGLSYHMGQTWLTDVADALAVRRGVDPGDERCTLIARMAMAAMASGVEGWIAGGCKGDLAGAIEASFDLSIDVFAELSEAQER